jgi:hypothetical protein
MKNKVILLLFVFLFSLFTSSVLAEDVFDVNVQVSVNDIYPTQTAKFYFTINNPTLEDDEYKLTFISSGKWSFSTDPSSYLSGVNVKAGEEVTFPVLIKASDAGVSYGMQSFPVVIKSKNSDVSKETSLQLLLRNPTPPLTNYLPSVGYTVDIADEIDPRESEKLKVHLSNKNSLNIKELTISIRSKLYNFDRVVSLAPLENRIEVFDINYDPNTDPIDDLMTIKVKVSDIDFTPVIKQVKIIAYKDTTDNDVIKKSFFKKISEYTYTNQGNINDKETVRFKTSLFSQLFTKTIPKASILKNEDGRFLSWELELAPKESQKITIIKNYRVLFYVLIIFILGIIAYYLFRSPILVKKESEVLKIEDQGVSHLKVLLHLKNRSNKPVDEVKLIDRVPPIASIDRDFAMGTLHPDKVIRHEHKGTILKWNISTLDPYEERIISYNIISKLKIIGGVTLPNAVVKFKGKGKKTRRILSNKETSKH